LDLYSRDYVSNYNSQFKSKLITKYTSY